MKILFLHKNQLIASSAHCFWRAFLFLCFFCNCQNILQAQPCTTTLNGNYTVGAGGDFATLTEAANTYNISCIAGPVTFNLIAATYATGEVYPIIFDRNVNAGPNTSLLIKPATGNQVVITGAVNSGALIKIQGDYIQIDGSGNGTVSRNLTINNTSIIEPRVIHFASTGTDAVTNCIIRNCEMINGNNDKSVLLISDAAIPADPGYCSNLVIENNSFKKGLYGVYCNMVNSALNGSGIQITSNLLNNTGANAVQFCGVYMEGVNGALIKDNLIGNFTATDSATDKGIWLAVGVKNTIITGNKIGGLNYTGGKGMGAHGILIGSGISNANITVANNMIYNISGDGNDYTSVLKTLDNPTGILLSASTPQAGIRLYHNTILLGGTAGFTNTLNRTNAVSACIRLRAGSTADIRNNILVNNLGLVGSTGFGATAILVSSSATQLEQLNYNDYFVNPTGAGVKLIGHIFNGNIQSSTLAAWRTATGKDAASLNLSPNFLTASDLHLNPSNNSGLNNKGIYLIGYGNDIDNTSRHPVTPDMGVDEFVPANTSHWIGIQSVDWSNASNWEANLIPDEFTDLEINSGFPYLPRMTANAKVRNLGLTGNGNTTMLLIDSAVNLEVYGSMTRTSGCVEAAKASLTFMGSGAQQLPEGMLCNSRLDQLMLGNSSAAGVSLSGALDVTGSVQFLDQGLRLNTNGFLTLKSALTGTAYVGDLTGKTISGDVTVERHIPSGINHGKSWQFLAVPVFGSQTINQAWQDSAIASNQNRYSGFGTQLTSNISPLPPHFDVYTPGGPSIKIYNSGTNFWEGIPNTNNTPIANHKGYFVFVRGDRSVTTSTAAALPTVLRAKGKLYTTSPDALPPSIAIPANAFESIGNPYASAIDLRNLSRSGGVDELVYVWDPTLIGTRGLGGYHAISSLNGYMPVPGGTLNYPSGIPCTRIESGQAFFMHATGAGGLVSFGESAKVSGSRNSFRNSNAQSNSYARISLSLFAGPLPNDRLADGCLIVMDQGFSMQADSLDAHKMLNGGENIGVVQHGKIFAIAAMRHPEINDTIQLYLSNLKKQSYQFAIQLQDTDPAKLFFLLDNYLGQATLLHGTDSIRLTFAVNDDLQSSHPNRFRLICRNSTVLPMRFMSIHSKRQHIQARINWEVAEANNVSGYLVKRSLDGKNFKVISDTIQAGAFEMAFDYFDKSAPSEALHYKVIAIENGIAFESPVTFLPAQESGFSGISITSDPMNPNLFVLKFDNRFNKVFSIIIFNTLGQPVYQTSARPGSSLFKCALNHLTPGAYIVCVTDDEHQWFSGKLLVR